MLSVIIPTLNESRYLPRALENLRSQSAPPDELLVVDGGSCDGTEQIAANFGATLLHQSPPITRQMNAGASGSAGDILLFLHADCTLEQDALRHLEHALSRQEIVGGAFTLEMRGTRPVLDRYLSRSGSWNAKRSQIYLGDHGIFCRRSAFETVKGFHEINLMYEFEFMRKLRACGKLVQLEKKCFTSGRRFQKNGYWKTMFLMRALRTLYRLKLPTTRLERIYEADGSRK